MRRRFSSKARKAAARSAPRPREPLHDVESVGHFAKVTVRQCATEAPQIKNGAQTLPHNDGVTVRQWAIEAPQMKNGAQALPHNDEVPFLSASRWSAKRGSPAQLAHCGIRKNPAHSSRIKYFSSGAVPSGACEASRNRGSREKKFSSGKIRKNQCGRTPAKGPCRIIDANNPPKR